MVDEAIDDIKELSKQRDHLPTAFNAAKHILDRGIGAVRSGEERGPAVPVVQIGIVAGDGFRADDIVIAESTRVDEDDAG